MENIFKDTDNSQKILIVNLKGSLDSRSSIDFYEYINSKLSIGYRKFIVSCDGLNTVSSAGISIILRLKKRLMERKAVLVYASFNAEILKVLALFNLDKILLIADNREIARKIIDSLVFQNHEEIEKHKLEIQSKIENSRKISSESKEDKISAPPPVIPKQEESSKSNIIVTEPIMEAFGTTEDRIKAVASEYIDEIPPSGISSVTYINKDENVSFSDIEPILETDSHESPKISTQEFITSKFDHIPPEYSEDFGDVSINIVDDEILEESKNKKTIFHDAEFFFDKKPDLIDFTIAKMPSISVTSILPEEEKKIESQTEVALEKNVQEEILEAIFESRVTQCETCHSKLKISEPGNFICPSCNSKFLIDKTGKIIHS